MPTDPVELVGLDDVLSRVCAVYGDEYEAVLVGDPPAVVLGEVFTEDEERFRWRALGEWFQKRMAGEWDDEKLRDTVYEHTEKVSTEDADASG